MTDTPDTLILNGALTTFDPACPEAQALAITDRHISEVGSTADIRALACPETRMIDTDLFHTEPENLPQTRTRITICDGEITFGED